MHTITTDHAIIKAWSEARGGQPVTWEMAFGAYPTEIGLIFRAQKTHPVSEDISWEQWFGLFDERALAFMYEADDGGNCYQLVDRHAETEVVFEANGQTA